MSKPSFEKLIRIYYNEEQKYERFLQPYNKIKEMVNSMLNAGLFINDDYLDLPDHWKYLEKCIPVKPKFLSMNSRMIVVEKYKSIIIAYSFDRHMLVVVFRAITNTFDKLKVGSQFTGYISKMCVSLIDAATEIFTDYFGEVKYTFDNPYFIEEDVAQNDESDIVVLKDVFIPFDRCSRKVMKIRNFYLVYSHLGAIIVPPYYSKCIDTNLIDLTIVGDVKFGLSGIIGNLFACWELFDKFSVYSNGTLYARHENNVFTILPENERNVRYSVATYNDQMLHFVVKNHEDEMPKSKPIEVDEKWRNYLVMNIDNFIRLQKKQRIYRDEFHGQGYNDFLFMY